VTLKSGYGSFTFVENGTVRQIIYDLLLVCDYLVPLSSYMSLNDIGMLKSGSLMFVENGATWKRGTVSYSHSIVTITVYRFWDIARHWSKIWIFYSPVFDAPVRGNISIPLGSTNEWCGDPTVKHVWWYIEPFYWITACDRRTDILRQHSSRYAYRAVKLQHNNNNNNNNTNNNNNN